MHLQGIGIDPAMWTKKGKYGLKALLYLASLQQARARC